MTGMRAADRLPATGQPVTRAVGFLVDTAGRSCATLLLVVALAFGATITVLDGAPSITLAGLASALALIRYGDLRRHAGLTLDAPAAAALEHRYALLCALLGLVFAVWASEVARNWPAMIPTVLLATTMQAFLAIPFLAVSYRAYFAITLPITASGLWLQVTHPLPESHSLSALVALSYLFAVRILSMHRRALFTMMSETDRRHAMDRQHAAMMANGLVAIALTDGVGLHSENERFGRLLRLPAARRDGAASDSRSGARAEARAEDRPQARVEDRADADTDADARHAAMADSVSSRLGLVARGFGLGENRLERAMARALARARRHGVLRLSLRYTIADAEPLWLTLEGRLSDPLGANPQMLWLITDDTANKKSRDELRYLAQHDSLTGLANRHLFTTRLRQSLARYGEAATAGAPSFVQPQLALLSIDLDGFKAVNDRHGHAVGDQLLVIVGKRLSHAVRSRDLVARFGGDEFMVLLEQVEHRQQASDIADKLSDLISAPVEFDDLDLQVGASIGLAMAPEDGCTIDALLNHADRQMYAVKHAARLPQLRLSAGAPSAD